MRMITVAIGILPIVAAEATARWIAAFGNDNVQNAIDPLPTIDSPIDLFTAGGDDAGSDDLRTMQTDPRHLNFFYHQTFRRDKPPGTHRIFVVGGSTVAGRPWATETSMTAWLQLRLQQLTDQTPKFETINCGGVSYASYRLSRIIDELLRYDPDTIVLYTGHNEFLERRTYQHAAKTNAISRWATLLARHSELVRAIKRSVAPVQNVVIGNQVDTDLDAIDGMDRYVRDDRFATTVHRLFESTLRSITKRVTGAGVGLVLCIPASDIVDTPPLKSTPRPGAGRHERHLHDQLHRIDRPLHQRTLAAEELLQIDPQHAGANYLVGRQLIDTDVATAAKHLIAAKDFDVCPLRATTAIQNCVSNIAAEFDVPLVDVPRLFTANPSDRMDRFNDPKWFVDHVHPSIAGHQRIAAAIHRAMLRAGWIGSDVDEPAYRRAANQHLLELDDAYFARGDQRLRGLQRWARLRGD